MLSDVERFWSAPERSFLGDKERKESVLLAKGAEGGSRGVRMSASM